MKIVRLLLLSGLLLALSVPSSAVTSCTQASCNSRCGGPNSGRCVNNVCLCF